jgi:large subunit ribosomal protein L14e
MIEVGRKCIKLAGRDAGKKAIIVEIQDDTYVLIDGEVRRKKCNINHLELLNEVVKISKGASSEEVAKALGIDLKKTKPKPKVERPKKVRGKKKLLEEKSKEKPKKKAETKTKPTQKEETLETLADEGKETKEGQSSSESQKSPISDKPKPKKE